MPSHGGGVEPAQGQRYPISEHTHRPVLASQLAYGLNFVLREQPPAYSIGTDGTADGRGSRC